METTIGNVFAAFDTMTLDKGIEYCNQRRVIAIYKLEEGVYVADVKGNLTYRLLLNYNTGKHACSCPVGTNCKHAAAATWHLFHTKANTLQSERDIENWLKRIENAEITSREERQTHRAAPKVALHYIVSENILSCKVVRLKKDGSASQSGTQSLSLTRPPQRKDVLACWDEADKRVFSEAMWTNSYDSIPLNNRQALNTFDAAIQTGRCFYRSSKTSPLTPGEAKEARFKWQIDPQNEAQRLVCDLGFPALIIGRGSYYYINQKSCESGPLLFKEKEEIVDVLLSAPVVPLNLTPKVTERFSAFPTTEHLQPTLTQKKRIQGSPHPVVRLSFVDPLTDDGMALAYADLSFIYEGKRAKYGSKQTICIVKENEFIEIERDNAQEELAADKIKEFYWYLNSHNRFESTEPDIDKAALDILENECVAFKEAGWTIEFDDSFPFTETVSSEESYFDLAPAEDQNWFDLNLGVRFGNTEMNLVRFFDLQKEHGFPLESWIDELRKEDPEKPIFVASDKKVGYKVKAGLLVQFFDVLQSNVVELENGKGSIPKWNLHEISGKLPPELFQEKNLKALIAASAELKNPPEVKADVQCTLRPYQQQGVNWLQAMRRAEFPAILADDMGLGKTVQTLAHLSIEKREGRLSGPSLLVGPTSLMHNWNSEIQRFLPSLNALVLHGSDREKHFDSLKNYDLILTTYPLLSRDQKILSKESFDYLILDEAHQIKNPKTIGYQVLSTIPAKHKLFLTGTPMENHLGEMWGLMSLLQPGLLGSEKHFAKTFRNPIEKKGDLQKQAILAKRVQPFMLRRTKKEVQLDLPEKTTTVQVLEMGEKQATLYEAIRFKMHSKVMQEINKKGLKRAHIAVLDGLLKLRQTCCDPRLLKIEYPNLKEIDSAKFNFIRETVPQLIEEGRKILLFSQFTSMLALIEKELSELGIKYTLLTGDTKDRKTPVDDFQSGKVPMMLISLKAGGVGLNLTAADTVIHYDPWWNPQAENQATDRAHRIGQLNPVHVYKLVTRSTIEEKILALQEKKAKLVEGIFNPEKAEAYEFTLEQIHELFS